MIKRREEYQACLDRGYHEWGELDDEAIWRYKLKSYKVGEDISVILWKQCKDCRVVAYMPLSKKQEAEQRGEKIE